MINYLLGNKGNKNIKSELVIYLIIILPCLLITLSATAEVTPSVLMVPFASIQIDGDFSDWQGIEPVYVDPAGDSLSTTPGTDFTNFYLARDSDYLYLRFDFANGLPQVGTDLVDYGINIDLPPSGPMSPGDCRVFWDPQHNPASKIIILQYLFGDNAPPIVSYDEAALANSSIEMRVPLNTISDPEYFFIAFMIGDANPDGSRHWVDWDHNTPGGEFEVRLKAVYDDFNGDSIDTTLWRINDPCHILSQSGGFLRANGPPYSCYGQLYSTRTFSGDFEFVLEYSDFQSTATVFGGNAPQIKLQVNSLSSSPGSPGDWIEIFRGYYIDPLGNHSFLTNGVINGSWTSSFRKFASSLSGSLKISRIGSTVTTYYNEGQGWVILGSFPGAFTGDVETVVGAYSGDDGTFNVSCHKVYAIAANEKPFADAGLDQTVDERTLVKLDGSKSHDPDGDPLVYSWEQIGGTPLPLDMSDPIRPTFLAPEVLAGGETFTFKLTVNDGKVTSEPDFVNIFVKNVNHPPIADPGDGQVVKEGRRVTLSGEASYDLDGEPLSFTWRQISGPLVSLSDPKAMITTFTAPFVGPSGANLVFKLTVSDGIDQGSESVSVFVENVNHPPISNAGEEQTKNEKSLVSLSGLDSSDPDGDSLTFNWVQVSGPTVVLSNPSTPTPYFTAPLVGPGGASLVFELTVNDGLGGVATDVVTIWVSNINDPPNCGLARAKPAMLWPPNHSLVPVNITNLTDPNNDQVTITILGVTQDEPVNGLGDGDTSPDAVISGKSLLLRAERAGLGNGRVYQISFKAEDSFGESCIGTVTICVPHDRRDSACGDDGQIYDSTTQ